MEIKLLIKALSQEKLRDLDFINNKISFLRLSSRNFNLLRK